MLNYILPIVFLIFGLFSLTLSKSKKNFINIADNSGPAFAKRINNLLHYGGLSLIVCALFWIIILFFEK